VESTSFTETTAVPPRASSFAISSKPPPKLGRAAPTSPFRLGGSPGGAAALPPAHRPRPRSAERSPAGAQSRPHVNQPTRTPSTVGARGLDTQQPQKAVAHVNLRVFQGIPRSPGRPGATRNDAKGHCHRQRGGNGRPRRNAPEHGTPYAKATKEDGNRELYDRGARSRSARGCSSKRCGAHRRPFTRRDAGSCCGRSTQSLDRVGSYAGCR